MRLPKRGERGFTQSLTLPLRSFVRGLTTLLTALRTTAAQQPVARTRLRTTAKYSAGFTLIELLVVIAIIGLLSSAVLSSLNSARSKSRDARRLSDVKQLQTALELAYDSTSPVEYPDALSTLVTGDYIASEPTDPRTGASYYYDNLTDANAACAIASGVCTNYVLGTNLENSSHGSLSGDIDGTVGSVNCTDPVYCVQP